MTGGGAVETRHASDLRKRGDYGGQGAEKGRQEMLPEIPNEVRRNWVGNTRRRDPRAERGLSGEGEACQYYRAFLPADPPLQAPCPRQTLTFSATLNPRVTPVPLPAPHPSRIGGGGSFTLALLVGLAEETPDRALIRGLEGLETQGGPEPG